MKYLRRKKKTEKTSTASLTTITESPTSNNSQTLTFLPVKEKFSFTNIISLIFQKRDPCFADFGIDPNKLFVDYLSSTPIREITLTKNEENGNFTFSLTQKIIPEIFNFDKKQAFLIKTEKNSAGDRLLAVNGVSVEGLSQDEIVTKITSSGPRVVCQVRQIREFTEIYKFLSNYDQLNLWSTEKRKSSGTSSQNSNFSRLNCDFWLLHRFGIFPCQSEGTDEFGEEIVSVHELGKILVHADCLERINPPDLDFIEDCSNLWHLNESGILHNLRSRFFSSLFTTFGGRNLIFLKSHVLPLSFCPQISELFYSSTQGESFPPHLFSLCQRLYKSMQLGGKSDQSLIFMGHEDSGQSELFKNSVSHFLRVPDGGKNRFTYPKWKAALTILETLTAVGDESGIFGRTVVLASLFYDSLGDLIGGSLKVELVNGFRILSVRRNIFSLMEDDCDGRWDTFVKSLLLIGIDDTQFNSIISILNSIRNLMSSTKSDRFYEEDSFISAAKFLSMSPESLLSLIKCEQRSFKVSKLCSRELILSFSVALFQNLVECVLMFINSAISHESLPKSSRINLLCHPGVSIVGRPRWLHSLYLGYFHEKINLLQYNYLFKTPLNGFSKENIDIDGFFVNSSAQEAVDFFENKGGDSQFFGLLRTLDNALRGGLNAKELVNEILAEKIGSSGQIVRNCLSDQSFIFMHSNLMHPVEYDCSHWPEEIALQARFLKMKNRLINSKIEIFSDNLLRNTSHFVTSPGHKVELISNDILEPLMSSDFSFIYCISPVVDSSDILTSSLMSLTQPMIYLNNHFDLAFVRIQLRAMLLVPAMRIFRYGYPDHMPLKDFKRFYSVMVSPNNTDFIAEIMQKAHIEAHDYAVGLYEVFMKDGVMGRLNDLRDVFITDYMVSLQSKVRSYLAIKSYQRIITIIDAVETLQHNMRVYLKLKQWRWWQLYVGVSPVASVSWVDSHLRILKEQMNQSNLEHERDLLERSETIHKLKNEVEQLKMEMMEDKINLTEAGEVVENLMEENKALTDRIYDFESSGDFYFKDQSVELKKLLFRVKDLETQVEKKTSDIIYWKRQASIQSGEKMDLKRQTSGKFNRSIELEKEEQMTEMKNKLEQLSLENQSLKTKEAQTEGQQREYREKIDDLNEEVEELTQKLSRIQQHCSALETEVGRFRMQEEETRDEADGKIRSIKKITLARCEELEDDLKMEKKKNLRLEDCNMRMSRELAKERERVNETFSDVNKLKAKVAKLKIMLKDAQVEKTSSRGDDLYNLQKQVDDKESALRTAQRNREEAESELAESRVLMNSFKRARDEMENRVRQVTSTLTDVELLADERSVELENMERSLKTATWEVSRLRETMELRDNELATAKKEMGRMKEKIFQLEEETNLKPGDSHLQDGLVVKLDLAESQNNRFQSQLKTAREDLALKKSEIDDLSIQNIRLEEELRSSSSKNRALEKEREAAREEKREIMGRMDRLQRDCGIANSALDDLRDENSALKARLFDLQRNITAEIEDSDFSAPDSNDIGNSDSGDLGDE